MGTDLYLAQIPPTLLLQRKAEEYMIPLQPVLGMKFMQPLGDKSDILLAEILTPK